MDAEFTAFISVWGLFIVFCLAALFLYGTRCHSVWKVLGVAGPTPAPFLGNIHQMFDQKVGVREAIRRWQEKYGRIFGIYYFRKPVLVITDPEALKQVFVKDFNVFVDRFFVGEGKLQHRIIQISIFFAQGASWRRLRKMMTPTFSGRKIKLLNQYINKKAIQLSENLCDYASKGTSVGAKMVFGAFTLDVIAGTAFGLDLDSQSNLDAPFIQHAKRMMTMDRTVQIRMALAGIFPVCIPLLKLFNIGYFRYSDIKFFRDSLKVLINERIMLPQAQSDLLQLLMESEFEDTEGVTGDKKLNTEEIAAQVLVFMIAGYETTSVTLQYLCYELATHQDVQQRMLDEIIEVVGTDREPTYDDCQNLKYCEAAVEETLRMYPPVHILTRLSTKDTFLGGIFVPANTGIVIPAYNIGRDPMFFSDPDNFDPQRFLDRDFNPATFLPFGFGPRQCIGMRLGMMEIKIALVHILRKVRVVKATPQILEIEDFNGTLLPKVPIQLTFQHISD